MKTKIVVWLAGITAVLLLLILTSVSKAPVQDTSLVLQEEQTNVAIRAIADALLKQNNDWTSPIPPIRQEGKFSYFIPLKAKIDYSRLRFTIDTILERHHIRPDYRVSLLDCTSGIVMLGFMANSQDRSASVACQDREQAETCYNLRLTLLEEQPKKNVAFQQPLKSWPSVKWVLLGLTCCLPLIWLSWSKNQQEAVTEEGSLPEGWQQKSEHTAFHLTNLLLKIDDKQLTLTYREAKLLDFFFRHVNQVLERERILQAVWEDEGIIVGRSLDVFVSRLRKKLKADPELNIVNVHGVGYKLEYTA